jgi:hypothetical protein
MSTVRRTFIGKLYFKNFLFWPGEVMYAYNTSCEKGVGRRIKA